jgi:hypothetical protein
MDGAKMIASLDKQIATVEQALNGLKRLRKQLGGESSAPRTDLSVDDAFKNSPKHLQTRLRNCMEYHWLNYEPPTMLSEVAARSRAELFRTPYFGRKLYREVWSVCVEHGFWDANDRRYQP